MGDYKNTILGLILTGMFFTLSWMVEKFIAGILFNMYCYGGFCIVPLYVGVFAVASFVIAIIYWFYL